MAELRAWQPGYIDRMRYGIASLLGDDRQAVRDAEKLTGLLEYTPVLGDAMTGAEAVDAYNQGDYYGSGLLGAATIAGLIPIVGDAVQKGINRSIKLYHGTTPEAYDEIMQSGILNAPVYMTPRKDIAEQYGDNVVSVMVDENALGIDLDLPSGKLLSAEDAASYLERPDLKTVQDFIDAGFSVGTTNSDAVQILGDG